MKDPANSSSAIPPAASGDGAPRGAFSEGLAGGLATVRARLHAAEVDAGRAPGSVTLVAVAKTRSSGEIRALAEAGVTDFGENYLQEAVRHQDALADLPLVWHFIGAVQSNKTRELAQRFDWVHTVDREKIARRLSDARAATDAPLNLCLQINLDDEDSKAGVRPEQAAALLESARGLPHVRIRGLMTIPAPRAEPAAQQAALARMGKLASELRETAPELDLDVLSMGMSDDLEAAVAAGATHVRIGTALFGPRG